MLKLDLLTFDADKRAQPPSGGCVLKLKDLGIFLKLLTQPPSGGCVLKH